MIRRFLDEYLLAFQGLLLAARKKTFWLSFLLLFILFGTLLNLLANGIASFRLIFTGGFSLAISILIQAFLGIFGINQVFSNWLFNFILAFLQASLFSLAILLARTQKATGSARKTTDLPALVVGLAVLGSGCPACGTALLSPLVATLVSFFTGLFSSSVVGSDATSLQGMNLVLTERISFGLNFLAILLGLLAFRKLGFQTYATIKSEQYVRKHSPVSRKQLNKQEPPS